MGQKGKFISQRAGYSLLWQDIWYSYKYYHSIYFQNILIKEFIYYLFIVGISTIFVFNSNCKKTSDLYSVILWNTNYYLLKYKTDYNKKMMNKEIIRPIKGVFFSKLHIIKFSNWLILCGNGYKWKRKYKKKFYVINSRLQLFYSSLLLLYEQS